MRTISRAADALYLKGKLDERSEQLERDADGTTRPDVAGLAFRFQENWTRYVLAADEQAERDRRIKNSPTFEDLARRAYLRAQEMIASKLAGATSYDRFRAGQKNKAKLSRNFFTDQSGRRWNLSEVLEDLLGQVTLRSASIGELWSALYSRLDELGLDPTLSDHGELRQQVLIFGYKSALKQVSQAGGEHKDALHAPRRFHIKYLSFANLVRESRRPKRAF